MLVRCASYYEVEVPVLGFNFYKYATSTKLLNFPRRGYIFVAL